MVNKTNKMKKIFLFLVLMMLVTSCARNITTTIPPYTRTDMIDGVLYNSTFHPVNDTDYAVSRLSATMFNDHGPFYVVGTTVKGKLVVTTNDRLNQKMEWKNLVHKDANLSLMMSDPYYMLESLTPNGLMLLSYLQDYSGNKERGTDVFQLVVIFLSQEKEFLK